jgi:uncharacterized protein YaeQ
VALPSTRLEYRITLNQVDRGVDVEESVIVARHPSETDEHVVLRLCAWCLLHEERLAFGPGLSTPDAADLWAHDLTGQLTTWIECGAADGERLRKVVQHHPGIAVHVVLDDPRRRDALAAELAAWKRPPERVTLWLVPRALVSALAARTERRQKWAVTVVGDHLYVDADGHTVDGELAVASPPLLR